MAVVVSFSKWIEAYALLNQEAILVSATREKTRWGSTWTTLGAKTFKNYQGETLIQWCFRRYVGHFRKIVKTKSHPQSDDGIVFDMVMMVVWIGILERICPKLSWIIWGISMLYFNLLLLEMLMHSTVHKTTRQNSANVLLRREPRLLFADVVIEDYAKTHDCVYPNIKDASNWWRKERT